MSIFIAELMGTMILILLGNGVVANVVLKGTKGNNSGWIVITAAWAFAVFCGVVVASHLGSGAHLNPAVTIALAIRDHSVPVVPYLCGEFAGAMLGAFLVWLFYKDHFDASSEDPGGQLACFSTGPAIKNPPLNLISEIIGTFVLVFLILCFAGSDAKVIGNLGALPVTIVIWALGLSLGGTTGYALNPARDLGPRIMHAILPMKGKGDSDWGYSWIPVAGPIIGGICAALLFGAL